MNALDESEEVDQLAIHVAFDHFGLISIQDKEFMIGVLLKIIGQVSGKIKKPLAIILHSFTTAQTRKLAYDASKELNAAGLTVFPSIQRAAVALGKFNRYHEELRAAGRVK